MGYRRSRRVDDRGGERLNGSDRYLPVGLVLTGGEDGSESGDDERACTRGEASMSYCTRHTCEGKGKSRILPMQKVEKP